MFVSFIEKHNNLIKNLGKELKIIDSLDIEDQYKKELRTSLILNTVEESKDNKIEKTLDNEREKQINIFFDYIDLINTSKINEVDMNKLAKIFEAVYQFANFCYLNKHHLSDFMVEGYLKEFYDPIFNSDILGEIQYFTEEDRDLPDVLHNELMKFLLEAKGLSQKIISHPKLLKELNFIIKKEENNEE